MKHNALGWLRTHLFDPLRCGHTPLFLLLLWLPLVAGCNTPGAVGRLFVEPKLEVRPALTNQVVTVDVQPVVSSPAPGVIVTNWLPVFITNTIVIPSQIVTNWATIPGVQGGLDIIEAVPGWGTIAAGIGGGVLSLWLGWLNRRQRQFSDSTVQAVEQFRLALRASGQTGLDSQLVKILEEFHKADGVAALASSTIDRLTGYTTAAPILVVTPEKPPA